VIVLLKNVFIDQDLENQFLIDWLIRLEIKDNNHHENIRMVFDNRL